MHTTVAWCCRACDAALESATVPDPPLCPACWKARRVTELTGRRAQILDELEAVEISLSRLGGR